MGGDDLPAVREPDPALRLATAPVAAIPEEFGVGRREIVTIDRDRDLPEATLR